MQEKRWRGGLKEALAGFIHCYRTERSMKIHTVAALAAFGLSAYLHLSALEWSLVVLVVAMVGVTEMVNTAVETTVDLISPEYHPLAKIAKDVAAGGVLMASLASLVMAYLLFIPKLFP
jgi:diacylglycerol kinase